MPDAPEPDANSKTTRRVLVACAVAREVAAVRHVLLAAGVEPHFALDASDVLRLAAELAPAAVLLDAAMPSIDLSKATRVLARNPATAASGVLLLAGPAAGERDLRRLQALESFALLERPLTCEAIRENLAAALAYHDAALALRNPAKPRPAAVVVEGCNSLLERTLHCPFHPYGVEVRHYALRAGKVYAHIDDFDVPRYRQAAPGADFVDYTAAAVCVCPECFFATTEPRFLDDPRSPAAEVPACFAADAATRSRVEADAGRRELLAHDLLGGEPAASFFDHRRTAREAVVAYALAVESGRSLHESAPTRRSGELARIGGYELRRAALLVATNPAAALSYRRAALPWLEKAAAVADGPAGFAAMFQCVAIALHLGDDAAATAHLTAMKNLALTGRAKVDEPAALDRYIRRAAAAWADRDRRRAAA